MSLLLGEDSFYLGLMIKELKRGQKKNFKKRGLTSETNNGGGNGIRVSQLASLRRKMGEDIYEFWC